MVNFKTLVFACAFLSSQVVWATGNLKVVESEAPAPAQMQPGVMYFSYKTFPFETWKAGTEKQVLNLFSGFRDVTPENAQPLIMFVGKTSLIINKPANQISLKKFQDMNKLQALQSDFMSLNSISPANLNTTTEKFLAYRNPAPNQTWCSDPQSMCLRSSFVFDDQVQALISLLFMMLGKDDAPISAESQLKIMDAGEIQNKEALKAMTGLPTEPTSMIKEDFFWFSNVVEYGKVIGVVQAHPTDPNKSVLTGYTVFAVEKKWWTFGFKGFTLEQALLGKRFNTSTGAGQGLPKVTQGLFSKIMGEL